MLSEVLEDVELQGHQLCTLDHNRSACIKGVLIYILHMVCWVRSSIQVEHRELSQKVLGEDLH